MPPAQKNEVPNESPRVEIGEKKNGPPRAELRIGDDEGEARHLSFRITSVHEKQSPSSDAPFHVKGGEWTFLDCQAIVDPKVTFTAGVMMTSVDGNTPAAWGKAMLLVKDREAGGRFVELFSKAFAGKLPAEVKRGYQPKPLPINAAILGFDMERDKEGGFSGRAGGWTATKWFPEYDGEAAEVYFNYDLDGRIGEFSEKDADYAEPLAAIFASALRDGPRPERTPENDPNITRIGPKIGTPSKLLSRRPSHYSFSPKGQFVVYQNGSSIFAVPIEQTASKPFEIERFDHSPWSFHVLDDNLNLIIQESVSETPGVRSSSDPMRIWWVDGKSKQKKLLRGPEKELNLAEIPVSPDGRYVVLSQWQGDPRQDGRSELLHFLDRESGKWCNCMSKQGLSVVGWRNTDLGLRLVAITNRWQFDKKLPSELYLADPATGKLERQENVDARLEIDNPISPDGRRRIRVGKDDLIVTDVLGGKRHRFVFHEDDRRFIGPECIEWVSPRYLKFNGYRLAIIDSMTMKMSYPLSTDGKVGSHQYKFSSDFRWVLYEGETNEGEGLFLAPVEVPKEG